MSSKIKTAGGIVIRDDKILFIYKNGRWDLPKGKLEKGNSSRETAIIEISEEVITFIIEKYTYESGVRKLKEILFEIISEINLESNKL